MVLHGTIILRSIEQSNNRTADQPPRFGYALWKFRPLSVVPLCQQSRTGCFKNRAFYSFPSIAVAVYLWQLYMAVLEGERAYRKLINVAHVSGAYNVGKRGGEYVVTQHTYRQTKPVFPIPLKLYTQLTSQYENYWTEYGTYTSKYISRIETGSDL